MLDYVWNSLLLDPMINALLWLYGVLGNNFFLSIGVFTIVLRVATLPAQLRQQRSTMKMQALQPQVQAIQKKYKDNQQKQLEELRKIGYNPTEQLLGCLPLLIQMPILIGLYRAILIVLGSTPQSMLELTQRVYAGIDLGSLLPIANKVGWLNLAQPDPYLILPVLVFATSFISQRVLSPSRKKDDKNKKKQDDNPMAGMTESMQYTMPIMFGFFALSFPAGLSIYWIITSFITFVMGIYTRRHMDLEAGGSKASESKSDASSDSSDNQKKRSKSATRSKRSAKKSRGSRRSRARR